VCLGAMVATKNRFAVLIPAFAPAFAGRLTRRGLVLGALGPAAGIALVVAYASRAFTPYVAGNGLGRPTVHQHLLHRTGLDPGGPLPSFLTGSGPWVVPGLVVLAMPVVAGLFLARRPGTAPPRGAVAIGVSALFLGALGLVGWAWWQPPPVNLAMLGQGRGGAPSWVAWRSATSRRLTAPLAARLGRPARRPSRARASPTGPSLPADHPSGGAGGGRHGARAGGRRSGRASRLA
jgi:hypothetical protein